MSEAGQKAPGAKGDAPKRELRTADIQKIMKLLPHRYPFLMIDRIEDMDGDSYGVGVKAVTINEPFFQGHFPEFPVMPGVLLIEGMAQTAGALCADALGENYEPSLVFFMTIDKAKFRRPVVPGDTVRYHVKKVRSRGRVFRFMCEAKVGDTLVAEAEVQAMIADAAAAAIAAKGG
jgi:3-hydroxyacyl-[acyl-carrier-protein] dehydratase